MPRQLRPSQVSLGENIDVDRISASYDNGVLSVILPVAERAKPRRIEVARNASAVECGDRASPTISLAPVTTPVTRPPVITTTEQTVPRIAAPPTAAPAKPTLPPVTTTTTTRPVITIPPVTTRPRG